tara:strand:+ start:6101 stop:6460 length:360 start_codon:yes stop_codon:yes gene_type:complete
MAEYYDWMDDVAPSDNLNRYITTKDANSLSWLPWFAWHPVTLESGERVWGQVVYRRKSVMYISRYPGHSPGDFVPRVKFKEYTYISDMEYLVEAIKGEESLFSKAQEIFRENREGMFGL